MECTQGDLSGRHHKWPVEVTGGHKVFHTLPFVLSLQAFFPFVSRTMRVPQNLSTPPLCIHCRLDAATHGEFSNLENVVLELCMDGVQWAQSAAKTMLPLSVRCLDIPLSHRNTKVGPLCYLLLHRPHAPYRLAYFVAIVLQGMRQCLALHPHPEPPCLDAFLTPLVEELQRFGPLQPQPNEGGRSYRARNTSRSDVLRVEKVHFVVEPDGSLNRNEVQCDTVSPLVMLGPVTSDSPMRARTTQRGWTASTFGAMCCMFQVGHVPAPELHSLLSLPVSLSLSPGITTSDLTHMFACMHCYIHDRKSHLYLHAAPSCLVDCPCRTRPALWGLPRW